MTRTEPQESRDGNRPSAECESVGKGGNSPGKQAPGENLLTYLLTIRKKRRYFPLAVDSSSTPRAENPDARF